MSIKDLEIQAYRHALAALGEDVVAILDAQPEWSADTVAEIADCAEALGLITQGPDGIVRAVLEPDTE